MKLGKSRGKTAAFIILVGILGCAFALHFWLNQRGVCRQTWSKLTSESAIQIALKSSSRSIVDLSDVPTEQEVRSYIQQHPSCCTVLDHAVLEEPFEAKKTWVRLLYPGKPGSFSNRDHHFEKYVPVSPCGEVGNSLTSLISEREFERKIQIQP